jgi:hypothetical protein
MYRRANPSVEAASVDGRLRFIHIDIMMIDGLDSELLARPLR